MSIQSARIICRYSFSISVPPAEQYKIEIKSSGTALERGAYNLTKYDDEEKVGWTSKRIDRIREAMPLEAQKQAAPEIREARGLTME